MYKNKIIIIGGGAAGFFSAVNIAEKHPEYEVTIIEKTNKVLSKVKISGGGRCNVTNACFYPSQLVKNYPRGGKKLQKMFEQFGPQQTIDWFAQRGVKLKTEPDDRIFPISNNSQTIIDCFLTECKKYGIKIITSREVLSFSKLEDSWQVLTNKDTFAAKKIIIATGNLPRMWKFLEKIAINIEAPVPSLFTFNIDDPRIKELQGISFDLVQTRIAGTKVQTDGPLLITHWGLSGPAVLKLSAFAARELATKKYVFNLLVNFIPQHSQEEIRNYFVDYKNSNPKQLLSTRTHFNLPKRYWQQLCDFLKIETMRWEDVGKKQINPLIEQLCNALFEVNGKSTFKEEFVTCGGVKLREIDLKTMQSKAFPGLYFAGEVLDIDAVTGGFNFQAAWASAYIVSENI
jgi:predicted Rossmann fold flavoprotein